MTKFLTVMTFIGLFAFKSQANLGDLQDLAAAITQFRQVITEMDSIYMKGEFKKGLKDITLMNARVNEALKYCSRIEGSFARKAPNAPDILEKRQAARNVSIEKQISLLDVNASEDLRSAQITLVSNLENAKYCLGLTSQLHTAIRASIGSQAQ